MKEHIFKLLEEILPYIIFKYIRTLYWRITTRGKTNKWQTGYVYKWNLFAKKKYFIVRFPRGYYDLFAAARAYIFIAEYAESKGMYPLIDIEDKADFEKGILGQDNMWELVFEQENIQEILKENVTILVSGIDEMEMYLPETCSDINHDPSDWHIHAKGSNWREYYRNIHKYVEKYWIINAITREENNELEMFFKEEKILGVSLREDFSEEYFVLLKSDELKEVFRHHPLGPNVNEIMEIVKEYLEQWHCTKIFLATLYKDSISRFEEQFPGQIIYIKRERFIMAEAVKLAEKIWIGDIDDTQRKRDNVRKKEYAKETILLSRCSHFIGAKSGGTIAALMLNGGEYEDIRILEDKRHVESY